MYFNEWNSFQITLKSPASAFFPQGLPKKVTLKITHNSSSPGQGQWNEMMNIDVQPNGIGRFLVESRGDDASLEFQVHLIDCNFNTNINVSF